RHGRHRRRDRPEARHRRSHRVGRGRAAHGRTDHRPGGGGAAVAAPEKRSGGMTMHVALISRDKPGHLQLRLDTRPTHLEFLKALNAEGRIAFAGPLVGPDGNPNGSLVVFIAESVEEAKEIAARDPYAQAGLFAEVV